ncbi:MAG: hypothetical protein ACF8XB_17960 [Planctomycetota bacterium JB042]
MRLLPFALLLSLAPAAAGQTFSAGDFAGWGWSTAVFQGSGSSVVGAPAEGGNPGAHAAVTNSPGASSWVGTVLHDPSAVWDPATDGGICRVSMSVEALASTGAFGQGQTVRCVVLQNGLVYRGGYAISGVPTTWSPVEIADLGESDFERFEDGSSPDFSPAGAPLTFGFATANSTGGGGYSLTNLYDNWAVDVVPGAPAAATPVGVGCGVTQPALAADAPVLGETFSLGLTGAAPGATGLLVAGLPAAAPVPLGGGCALHLLPVTLVPLVPISTDGAGNWSVAAPVPDDVAFCGVEVTVQALLASASPIGFDVSNGVELTLGG